MTHQPDLFGGAPGPTPIVLPDGFRYEPELITAGAEADLVEAIGALPFREFEFHGYTGKRRVVSFGWRYDFSARTLERADDMPLFLRDLREPAAAFAGMRPEQLQHVLVTEYSPGAGIGWHKDKAVFGDVVGISLVAPCTFRLRRGAGAGWERVNLTADRRSAYLLRGVSRTDWEHSIPPVDALRYSVTYRNLRDA
ncbi:MAG TPA: alpha-ketoglutarate-dependent dioxygenase AlkB [Gemmatimonas sp.]|nr:alpha-ketoglutarate-dependent dioxygenase AlkB [Gemmatimonas sp.]